MLVMSICATDHIVFGSFRCHAVVEPVGTSAAKLVGGGARNRKHQ